jgi:transcriptional regulator with XRE-family HTH domain
MRVLLLPPTLLVWATSRNSITNINPHIWQRPRLQDALTVRDSDDLDYLTRHEGLSQRQLAKLLGRSQSQISEIIVGRKMQMYGVLVDFAKRLSIPPYGMVVRELGIPDQATTYMHKAHGACEKYRTSERVVPWLAGFNAHGPSGLVEATYREL